MKLTQFFMLIAVVVAIVGGAAFMLQWINVGPAKPVENTANPEPPPSDVKEVTYFVPGDTDADGRPLYSVYLPDEVEVNKPGRCDFAFENKTDTPLEMGLYLKGCTCQTVEAMILTPEQLKKIPTWPPPDLKNRVGADAFLGAKAPWKHLEDNNTLQVPVGAKGFVRLGWSTKKQEPVRLKAAVWTRPPGVEAKDLVILQVEVNIVSGVQVYPVSLTLKPVDVGETQSTTCWVWSATRESFKLKPSLEHPNPSIRFSMRPLTPEERADFKDKDKADRAVESRTTVRSGYEVTVEIHNDRSGPPMDLGPFDNKIHFDCEEPGVGATAELAGAVRNIIRVVSTIPGEPPRDFLMLARFRADEGITREFALEADDSNLGLKIDSWAPAYLKVSIEKDSNKEGEPSHWVVKVTVPPNVESGRMPRGSSVVFLTNEKAPRRIRIPVLGIAYKGTR